MTDSSNRLRRTRIRNLLAKGRQQARRVLPPFGTPPRAASSPLALADLEPRLLFSATPVPMPVDAAPEPECTVCEVQPTESDAAAHVELRRELIVIDQATPDYGALVDGLMDASDAELEILLLSDSEDGIEQLTAAIQDREGLDAIHLISHGTAGQIQLGSTTLSMDNIAAYAGQLGTWTSSLHENADLLVYGCDFAATPAGHELIQALGILTGTDVAASDDVTGHESLGGDWELEIAAGDIETDVPFTEAASGHWEHQLAVIPSVGSEVLDHDGVTDTFISSGQPAASNDGSKQIRVDGDAITQGLIRFDDLFGTGPGQIPYGSTIESAELTVNVKNGSTADAEITLHRMLQAWSGTDTWNSLGRDGIQHDDIESVLLADSTLANPHLTGAQTFAGLASTLQLWSNGTANNGWVISNSGGDHWIFRSSEDSVAVRRPELTVQFTAPNATDPVPDAGGPYAIDIGDDLALDASGSTDPQFDAMTFSWDLDNDGSFDDATGETPNISWSDLPATVRAGGMHTIRVQADDGTGNSAIAATTLTVSNSAPNDLTFNLTAIDENSSDGTLVGTATGTDANRDGRITALLAANPNLTYSAATGKFYEYINSSVTWTTAQADAVADTLDGINGQLVTVRSAAEQGVVQAIAAAAGKSIWLGGSDKTTEGDWVWYDGLTAGDAFWTGGRFGAAATDAFTNWAPGEPNNFVNQDYLRMYATGANAGRWDDIWNSVASAYVVEWNAGDVLDQTESLTYSLVDDAGGRFSINSTTGAITVANGSLLDFDTDQDHDITVRVTDASSAHYDEVVTINLNDQNDIVPTIDPGQVLDVDEDVGNGTSVGFVTATDPDTVGSLTNWTITAGNVDSIFTINNSTGELTVVDNTNLDYETTSSYTLSIRVEDGLHTSAVQTLTVDINDVADTVGPITDIHGGRDRVAENSAAGTTARIQAAATDPDGDAVTFSLDDDADGRFQIDAASGVVTVRDGLFLDYEDETSHTITVRATSADTSFSTRDFTIAVRDVDEATLLDQFVATEYDGNQGSQLFSANWEETGEVTNPHARRVQVVAGKDTAELRIGSPGRSIDGRGAWREADLTGATYATLQFEYRRELHGDAGGNVLAQVSGDGGKTWTNLRTYDLKATDASATLDRFDISAFASSNTQIRFLGSGTDVDSYFFVDNVLIEHNNPINHTIRALTDTDPGLNSVSETAADGTAVGITAFAMDLNAGDTVTYTLDDNAGGRFSIGSSTGVVRVLDSSLLDFESNTSHSITVRASSSDGSSVTKTVGIGITDVNDTAPVITTGQVFGVDEDAVNLLIAGRVTATDADTVGAISGWSIVGGNPGGVFGIHAVTGDLYIADASGLDHETMPVYTVQIKVGDGVQFSAIETVTVNIGDVNEQPIASDATFSLPENSANGTRAGVVPHHDPDSGLFGTLTHAIAAGDPDGVFTINPATGQIIVRDATHLDFESTAGWTLTVTTTDGGGLQDSAQIRINLTDVNETPTVGGPLSVLASETDPVQFLDLLTGATDPDDDALSAINLSVLAGDGSGLLKAGNQLRIDPSAYVSLSDGESEVITIAWTISDGHGGHVAQTGTITITGANTAPVGRADSYAVGANQTLTVTGNGVLTNDLDPDSPALSAVLVGLPTNGTVTLNADGSFTYVPGEDFSGLDSFTYRPTDGAAAGSVTTVDIMVAAAPPSSAPDDPGGDTGDPEPPPTEPDPGTTPDTPAPEPTPGDEIGGAPPPNVDHSDEKTDSGPLLTPEHTDEPLETTRVELFNTIVREFPDSHTTRSASATASSSSSSSAASSLDELASLANTVYTRRLTDALDEVGADIRAAVGTDRVLVNAASFGLSSLSVGYVLWLLRGGSLVASMLTSIPAWRMVDPLPILDILGDNDGDDESLESVIAKGQAATQETTA